MAANPEMVKETTTTTGTGNLTLSNVTGFKPFNTAFGTGGQRFPYYIYDSTNNVWECGEAYLSASTTLVREKVVDNSSGTTSALTLSAGTKDVLVDVSRYQMAANYAFVNDQSTVGFMGYPLGYNATSNKTMSTNAMMCIPCMIYHPGTYTGTHFNVVTADGSGKYRIGLYQKTLSGTYILLAETADLSVGTTGHKQAAFSSSVELMPGDYLLGFGAAASTLVVTGSNSAGIGHSSIGVATTMKPNAYLQFSLTPSWTSLPSAPTSPTIVANTVAPLAGLY